MQLNELVKNYSINTISQKTKIPVEVLEKLINRDWENLQKTKVNGFLQIIEREFDIDLNEIIEEAKNYYQEHTKERLQRPIDLVDAQVDGGSSKRVIANILTVVILALVTYAAWFYMAKDSSTNVITDDNSSKGMFRDSIDAAKNLLGVSDKNTTKVQEEPSKRENQATKTDKTTETAEKVENKQDEQKSVVEHNNSKSEQNDTQRVTKKFDITSTSSDSSAQSSTDATESKTVALEDTQKSELVDKADENSSKSIASQEDSSTKEANSSSGLLEDSNISNVDSNLSDGVDVKLDENITVNDSNLTTSENNLTQQAVNTITITPTVKKIWIGIYNLKTKKRVVKVAKGAYDYSANGADVAIVTGHSRFKIATDSGASSEYHNAGKRKYLLVTKDGIKVLTKQEYKRVTNRRAW